MACHELAALRLGLMRVVGIEDEAEKQHDLNEIGDAAQIEGPIKALLDASDLASLKRFYEASLTDLAGKVAALPAEDAQMPYYKSLLVLTKKVEQELSVYTDSLTRLWSDLEEVHDFLHETFPKE